MKHPRFARAWVLATGTTCVLLAPHLGVPMFAYPLFGAGLCVLMLRWQGLRLADIGLRWRDLRARPLLVGGGFGVAYALLNYAVIGPLLALLLQARPDLSDFAFVREMLTGYLVGVALAWIIGGLYEELVFRGFLQGMLEHYLLVRRGGALIAAGITALAFAAYHWQLGAFGIANAFVFALVIAAVRQRCPDNLWYAIAFHACADTTAFTLMRMGWL